MTKIQTQVPFRLIYDQLRPQFNRLEKARKRAFWNRDIARFAKLTGFFTLASAIWLGYLEMIMPGSVFLLGGLGILIAAAAQAELTYYAIRYKNTYLEIVYPALFTGIDADLKIDSSRYKPDLSFESSHFLHPRAVKTYEWSDVISGKKGATAFKLCHLQAFHDSEVRFQGLFFQADFHKHFDGFTAVTPRRGIHGFKLSLKRFKRMGLTEVLLEDPRFDEQFAVFTDNQVTARYILSPSFMETILHLQAKYGCQLFASFQDEDMYLGLDLRKEMFTVDIHSLADDRYMLQKLYEELRDCVSLIDQLNLNRRIWSKQGLS